MRREKAKLIFPKISTPSLPEEHKHNKKNLPQIFFK